MEVLLGLELEDGVADGVAEALLVSELAKLTLDEPVGDAVVEGLKEPVWVWLYVALWLPVDELLVETDGVMLGLEVSVPEEVSVELEVMELLGLAVREGEPLPVSLVVVLVVPD